MATKIATMSFESPLSLEGSWGSRPIADKATSVFDLYYNQDDTGYIEWECEEMDMYECIGLTFEFDEKGNRTLTDYDGVMTLPDQAMDLLEQQGVDCSEMRASLAD